MIASAATLALLVGVLLGNAAPAGAATRPIFQGIDVSVHQHPGGAEINWKSVRKAGVRFAIVKATEGSGRAGTVSVNPWFASDWEDAQAAGVLRGAYHYARPRAPLSTAISDADRFVAVVKAAGHGRGDIAPVLDLEETGGLSAKALSDWTASWLAEVTALTGKTPIIYSGRGFWTSYLTNTTRFAKYPLWIAHHTSAGHPAALPGGWTAWTFWQYSATGRIPGIKTPVDLNWSCGTPGVSASGSRPAPCASFGKG